MGIKDEVGLGAPITPARHAMLDYGVATTFLGLAFRMRQNNPRASTLALINGAMVLGMSLFTDYPGGVWRRLSFKTHRTLDIVQACLAGVGPILFGFGHTREARTFYTQAASEVGVIAKTDWDGVERARHPELGTYAS